MSSQQEVYQKAMWQQKSASIFDYTNLIIKKGLTIKEVADKRGVPVDEVKSALNFLKTNNPMLYSQVKAELKKVKS